MVLICWVRIWNFQVIIRCLIYVASFKFIFKSVHSGFYAQACCRRGGKKWSARSAWYSGPTESSRWNFGEPKTMLFINQTPVPNLHSKLSPTWPIHPSGKTNTGIMHKQKWSNTEWMYISKFNIYPRWWKVRGYDNVLGQAMEDCSCVLKFMLPFIKINIYLNILAPLLSPQWTITVIKICSVLYLLMEVMRWKKNLYFKSFLFKQFLL